jgi:hypothetical protein
MRAASLCGDREAGPMLQMMRVRRVLVRSNFSGASESSFMIIASAQPATFLPRPNSRNSSHPLMSEQVLCNLRTLTFARFNRGKTKTTVSPNISGWQAFRLMDAWLHEKR